MHAAGEQGRQPPLMRKQGLTPLHDDAFMRLIFIGPPGSGKGTQAELLSQRLGLCHFATGDILREAVRQGTPEGQRAQSFLAAGQLVPDDVVNDIVESRFRSKDRPSKFVMDGYPRNLAQAVAFDEVLREQGLDLDSVVFLKVDDQEIIKRISARWNCPNPSCPATYNTTSRPPKKPGICDECQTPLVQREDDKAETVRQRLKVFHDLTDELLAYYRERNLVVDVPGFGDIETIYRNIVNALRKPTATR
jgi:adenylate kinase